MGSWALGKDGRNDGFAFMHTLIHERLEKDVIINASQSMRALCRGLINSG